MLKIRLQRTGRKHEPTFRLVLTDSKNSTKSGRYLEVLGSHDFRKETTDIKGERVKYWMGQGAQATDTVHNLLLEQKVIEGKKKNVLPKKTVPKKEEPVAEAPAPEPVDMPPAEPEPASPPVVNPEPAASEPEPEVAPEVPPTDPA